MAPLSFRLVTLAAILSLAGCGSSTQSQSATSSAIPSAGPTPTTGSMASVPAPSPTPTLAFVATGSMSEARVNATATVLQSGEVLIAGGSHLLSVDSQTLTSSAELYDPMTRKFTRTGSMITARMGATATLLPDGRVLIAGGYGCRTKACNPEPPGREQGYLTSAELYDPATGKFTATGSMEQPYGTAALLPDGRVLMLGGGLSVSGYEPTSGTFARIGSLLNDYDTATATPVAGGQVLVVGYTSPGQGPSDLGIIKAELFDLASGGSSPISLPLPTSGSAGPGAEPTAVPTSGGAVLLCLDNYVATYDPATRSFSQSVPFSVPNEWHGATTTYLAGGRFLFTGGETDVPSEPEGTDLAGIYDPGHGLNMIESMIQHRHGHTATLLPDGTILIAGGMGDDHEALSTAELLGS